MRRDVRATCPTASVGNSVKANVTHSSLLSLKRSNSFSESKMSPHPPSPPRRKRLSRHFVQATERSGIASAANSFKENLRADEGAPYDEVIEIDLDKLQPHVNGPFTPDLAHSVGAEFSAAVKVRGQDIFFGGFDISVLVDDADAIGYGYGYGRGDVAVVVGV